MGKAPISGVAKLTLNGLVSLLHPHVLTIEKISVLEPLTKHAFFEALHIVRRVSTPSLPPNWDRPSTLAITSLLPTPDLDEPPPPQKTTTGLKPSYSRPTGAHAAPPARGTFPSFYLSLSLSLYLVTSLPLSISLSERPFRRQKD